MSLNGVQIHHIVFNKSIFSVPQKYKKFVMHRNRNRRTHKITYIKVREVLTEADVYIFEVLNAYIHINKL